MKHISILLLSLLFLGSTPKPTDDSFVMIQLFTSQGCSSCPPADRLVENIKEEYKDQNVYVMSYHVDYWNRLGWKDPFSKREYTELQYSYAQQFKERRVYTPQIVVNGSEHFVGSDGYKLRNRIKSYLQKAPQNRVTINSKKQGGNLELTFAVDGDMTNKKLKLVYVLENEITKVKRGENSNKTLSNSNIVFKETQLKLNDDNQAFFTVPIEKINHAKNLTLIAFVQNDQLKISGAAQVEL